MKKALVMGGGMVGQAIAFDLARGRELEVTVADVDRAALDKIATRFQVKTVEADLSKPEAVRALVAGYDVVVGALPSVFGLQTLRAVIEAKKPYCDISFMPEDGWELDMLARERGTTAVIDCGVAPGMSNLLAGYGHSQLDRCERIEIYVGGLPLERTWPYEYKATFAPHDVLEEYVRPARIVEHGKMVTREALSEPELMHFDGLGTLEAFNTDGLRSLAYTLKGVPFMKEKTLRYPGHIELMRVLRETGLFSKEPVSVKGGQVRPLDVTAALLFPKWTFEDGERDITVMRVTVEGEKAGKAKRFDWSLVDRHDPETGLRSMPRTTGFPASIMTTLLARGTVSTPGVHPPELLAREPGLVQTMLTELAKRGVVYEGPSASAS